MLRHLVPSLCVPFALAVMLGAQEGHQAPAKPLDPKTLPSSTVTLAPGLEYADPLTVKAPHDLLRDCPVRPADGVAKGLVHAVVEIPTGTCEKWEVKLDGVMRWDIKDGKPRHVHYLGYPCNYGIVPRAILGKEIGGDGDPLDILVLGPALPRGTVVAVQVIGTIKLIDGGETDDKLIAVVPGSPLASAHSVAELDTQFPGIAAILRTWFENYKGAGKLQCQGFGDVATAMALVAASEKSFAAAEAKGVK